MRKHTQLFLVVIAFVITLLSVGLLGSPPVIGAMAGAFLSVVGAYTALDLRAVVKSTGALPSGTFAVAHRWKYFLGVIFLLILFAVCILKDYFYGLGLDLAYGFLGPGAVTIIAFVVGGMKLNKAATAAGPPNPEASKTGPAG